MVVRCERGRQLQPHADQERRICQNESRLHHDAYVEENPGSWEQSSWPRQAELAAGTVKKWREQRALQGCADAQRVQVDTRWDGLADLLPALLALIATEPRAEGEYQLAQRRVDVEEVLAGDVAVDELSEVVLAQGTQGRAGQQATLLRGLVRTAGMGMREATSSKTHCRG